MDSDTKRKAVSDDEDSRKRTKSRNQWRPAKKNNRSTGHATSIQAGDAGVWATCPMGKERQCINELRDLFTEYARAMYPEAMGDEAAEQMTDSIEQDIQAEVQGIQKPPTVQLFTAVRLDVQCVVFFKTHEPVEPVSLVTRICEDASRGKLLVGTRMIQRLTPMSMMGYASSESLDKIASQVLAASFHGKPPTPQKYAIRTNMRNHNTLKREPVIKQVASAVGPGHTVDLKHYDLLILVEIYKNLCGMSVVTAAFDRLKRFNLAELAQIDQDPLPTARVGQERLP